MGALSRPTPALRTTNVTIHTAKTHLSHLIEQARRLPLPFPELHGNLRAQVDTGHRGAPCQSSS